jgi:hypothetical protein
MAGVADWCESAVRHRPWVFAVLNPKLIALCTMTLSLQCLRLSIRTFCAARIFGVRFSLGVPLRSLHANFVNCFASLGAMWRYVVARVHRRPLVWLKTEHVYPSRDALLLHRRELTDVLVGSGYISEEKLQQSQARMTADTDLADFLLTHQLISDDDLCKAISLQSGVPAARIDPQSVKLRVMRTLPAHVEKRLGVLPVDVQAGRILMAGSRVPSFSAFEELKNFTRLPVEFQLVTRRNYEELRDLL